jgi:uncharacterized membrane protein
MDFGVFVVLILRLLHIFGAFAWIGGAMFLNAVVLPTVKDAGPDGGKFMQWVGRTGRLTNLFTAASITTVLAGVILLYPISGGFQSTWFGSAHGIVLSIGGVIGILALLHGIFGAGAVARKSAALAKEMAAKGGPPSPDQMQMAQALGARSAAQARISMIIGALALLFMAAAQSF